MAAHNFTLVDKPIFWFLSRAYGGSPIGAPQAKNQGNGKRKFH